MTATASSRTGRGRDTDDLSAGWGVLGLVGLALFSVGVVDLLLSWFPPQFGSPEWEFGTISSTLNSLPVPAMGLALVLAYGAATERKALLAVLALWSVLVTIFLVVAAVFYALDVPLALRTVTDPVPLRGLKIAIVKAVVAFVAYLTLHAGCALIALRNFRRPAR